MSAAGRFEPYIGQFKNSPVEIKTQSRNISLVKIFDAIFHFL